MTIVTVTREDITRPIRKVNEGMYGWQPEVTRDCPLARGLNRAVPTKEFSVGLSTYYINSERGFKFLSKKAEKFRQRFDRGGWFMRKWLVWRAPWKFEFPDL